MIVTKKRNKVISLFLSFAIKSNMKKRIFCFVTVIMLMLSLSVNVFATDTTNNSENTDTANESSQGVPDEYDFLDTNTLGPTNSLRLIYAKMQLELSSEAEKQAQEMINQVAALQEEQKLVSSFLNTARQLQNESKENRNQTSRMPDDMYAYINENNLGYDKSGDAMLLTAEEWDTVIVLLESRLMELGTETQQKMVYVQNLIGQYNSYLQDSNTQTPNSSQVITSLARAQSMYGDSEVGLAVTALVVGLVLGCVITLAAQKVRRKKSAV